MMQAANREAEKIKLRAFKLALDVQLSRKDMYTFPKDEEARYRELSKKAELLWRYLSNEPVSDDEKLYKEKEEPEESPSLLEFTKERMYDWSGLELLDNVSTDFTHSMLLFIRHWLSTIAGDDLNWIYRQNTALLDAAETYVEELDNPWDYDLEGVHEKLDSTRWTRRHWKHHPAMGIYVIDAILAGMRMHKGAFYAPGEKPSLFTCFNQLPDILQLELKIGLVDLLLGHFKFWTKYHVDSLELGELEDILWGDISVRGWIDMINLFGQLVQFGFLLQAYGEKKAQRDAAQHALNALKIELEDAVCPVDIALLKDNIAIAEAQLLAMNNELGTWRAGIMLLVVDTGLTLLCLSFGPMAAWIPVAIAIIEAAMDLVELVVEQGMGIADIYEDKVLLQEELRDREQELKILYKPDEKQMVIKNILVLRNQIQDKNNEIRKAYLDMALSVVLELMVSTVRFVSMAALPLDIGLGVVAFAKLNESLAGLMMDFLATPKPAEEKLPYKLSTLGDRYHIKNGMPAVDITRLKAGKLYVERTGDDIQYAVLQGGMLRKGSFKAEDLDIMLDDDIKDDDLVEALEPWLMDILALTESRGDTRMLKQLSAKDDSEKSVHTFSLFAFLPKNNFFNGDWTFQLS